MKKIKSFYEDNNALIFIFFVLIISTIITFIVFNYFYESTELPDRIYCDVNISETIFFEKINLQCDGNYNHSYQNPKPFFNSFNMLLLFIIIIFLILLAAIWRI